MKSFKYNTFYLAMLSGIALHSVHVVAQEEQEEDLERIAVTGARDPNSIMPLESSSVFGLGKSLAETPRSITEVSSDLIEAYSLRSVDDLVRITPGAFTSSFFGIQGAMDIRGESADNYFRGFRRIANPGAFKTNIRGAKSLEVLRGPVSPLYGTGSVGGQLNYSPKSAKSDATKYVEETTAEVHVTLGTYSQKILAAEAGIPFTIGGRDAGIYIFAEAEDSDSFYDGYNPTHEMVQVALDVDLSEDTVMEFGFQFQTSDAIQVPGWNRVTQDLIDNGTYITGAPVVRNTDNPIGADRLLPQESGFISPFAPFFINSSFSGVGTFCSPGGADDSNYQYNGMSLFCPGVPDGIEAAFSLSNPGTTQIDHQTTFIDEIDFADSTALTAYLDFTSFLSDDMTWKNQFYFDYMDHTKFQSWGFTADYPDAKAMEFRSSLQFSSTHSNAEVTHITGVSIRNEDLDLNHAFFDETFDFRDISVGPTPDDRIDWAVDDPYENATIIFDDEGNPVGIDGTVRRNYNEEQVSTVLNAGLFYLADITVDQLSVLLGARYDYFDVEAEEQAVSLLGIPYGDGVQKDTESALSYNLSVSYKMDAGFVPYATYATSNSLSTNQLGGIIASSVDNGEYLAESKLAELGVKYTSEDGDIFAGLTLFDQEKEDRIGQLNALVAVYSKGLEFELRALLNNYFSLTATATKIETTEVSDGALAVINGADFAIQNGLEPYQVYGGRIAGNRSTFVGTGAELDRGGLPDHTVSMYLNYNNQLQEGRITASLGFGWADETYTDVLETILLPSYMVWSGSVGYVTDKYRIMLSVNNLFEEEYYTSADLFDSVVVKPSEGRTGSIMFSYAF